MNAKKVLIVLFIHFREAGRFFMSVWGSVLFSVVSAFI